MQLHVDDEVNELLVDRQEQNDVQPDSGMQDDWLRMDETPFVVSAKPKMTKKEFYKSIDRNKERSNITLVAFLCYFMGVVNVILGSILFGGVLGSIDGLFMIGMGIGLQFFQSRVCAFLLTGYAGLNVLLKLFEYGRPRGIYLVFAGVVAIKATMDLYNEWKMYNES